MARISVVIATRERPAQLLACLTALAASFPADAETIVVSDDAGDIAGLEPLAKPLRLRALRVPPGGPAAARNRGLAVAAGDVVAFTDDDCVPRPGWLTAVTGGVTTKPPRATGGTTVNGLPSNAYADFSQLLLDLVAQHDVEVHGREQFFASNNVAFPATALRELGGFDESFRTAEDRDLCRRWRQAGHELLRVPQAVVEHRPVLDLAGFVRRFYAYGQGAAHFHSSWHDGIREAASFHLSLPRLLGPAVRGRGILGGTRLLGLAGLWELANVAGYATGARG